MEPIPRSTDENKAVQTIDKKKTAKSKAPVKKKKLSFDWKWTLSIFFSSIVISGVFSLLSGEITGNLGIVLSFAILISFILIGVLFDIVGLSIATADVKPFHSMSARKLAAGRKAVKLINNADRASSICNDVVGDIAGVVSGSTAAAISLKIAIDDISLFWVSLLLCASVSGFTVGLKALGKSISLNYSHEIVYTAARILTLFSCDKKKTDTKK